MFLFFWVPSVFYQGGRDMGSVVQNDFLELSLPVGSCKQEFRVQL